MCVGKLFPLAVLLYNLWTICYGNNIMTYMGEEVLLGMSVREYLGD